MVLTGLFAMCEFVLCSNCNEGMRCDAEKGWPLVQQTQKKAAKQSIFLVVMMTAAMEVTLTRI